VVDSLQLTFAAGGGGAGAAIALLDLVFLSMPENKTLKNHKIL
jgi:hypothetical protein